MLSSIAMFDAKGIHVIVHVFSALFIAQSANLMQVSFSARALNCLNAENASLFALKGIAAEIRVLSSMKVMQ